VTDFQHDLLTDPIFGVEGIDGRSQVSLAGLLARLGRREATEMTGLMPHQQHAWYALVVQLAALVLARSGDTRLDRSEQEWRDALRALGGSAEAFALVVPDLAKPAFMQPPVPERTLDEWNVLRTPDALDVLVTAKNHDVKQERFRAAAIEHWVYALVSLQTTEGYSGRDNHGVARMNGGFSSRPSIGAAGDVAFDVRYARDVTTWLRERDSLVQERGYEPTGTALLWTVPWDGTESLALSTLDPAFIEVCRRIRLTDDGASLEARSRATKVPRIAAKELKGATGDVWTPLKMADGAALTVSGDGFGYKRMAELLFSADWRQSPAQLVRSEDGREPVFIARALVRGQGKTEGLHERVVPVPEKAKKFFAPDGDRSHLGSFAKARIERVAVMRNKVLKPALLAIAQGGPAKVNFDDKAADVHIDAFEARVDALFFAQLFDDAELDASEAQPRWDATLLAEATAVKKRAERSIPIPISRRQRALAAGDRAFVGSSFKQGFRRPTADVTGGIDDRASD